MAGRAYAAGRKPRLYRTRGWLIVMGAIVLYFVAALVPAVLFDMGAVESSVVGSILTMVFLGAACSSGMFGIKEPRPAKSPGMKEFAGWFSVFVLSSFFLELLFRFMDARVVDPGMEARADAISGSSILLYVVFSILVAPATEEVMMRLFCYGVLRSRCTRFTATLGSAVIFAALHGTVTHMVVATILGCILVFSYESTGKWWVPILGHFTYNMCVLFGFNDAMLVFSESNAFMVLDVAIVSVLLFGTGWYAWFHGRKEAV